MMKRGQDRLSVTAMRRAVFYRPLALLLAVLLSPALSELGAGRGPKPLQAAAQVVQGCESTTNSIIRNYCVDGISYGVALSKLEQDAVANYLSMNGMPQSEASVIYTLGRTDLRNAVRAQMYAIMVDIIEKKAEDRSQHERTLYLWLQSVVQGLEAKMYQEAFNHLREFQLNPCGFRLDPDLAKVYGLEWSGTAFCFGGFQSGIFTPSVPNAGYFEAYGAKRSYMARAFPGEPEYDPQYAALFADTAISNAQIAGVAMAAGSTAALVAGTAVTYAFLYAVMAKLAADAAVASGTAIASAASGSAKMGFLIGAKAVTTVTTVSAAVSSATIVFVAVVAAVIGSYELYNNEKQTRQVIAFANRAASARVTPPDLSAILNVSSEIGTFKIQNAIYSQTSPDVPSTAPLPVRQAGDLGFFIETDDPRSPQRGTQRSFKYLDWSNNVWTVSTSGHWFVSTCAVGERSTAPCTQTDSISNTLRYNTYDRSLADNRVLLPYKLMGFRMGRKFMNVNTAVTGRHRFCPMDPRLGVSGESLGSSQTQNCLSFVSDSLDMYEESGSPMRVSVTPFGAPEFVDPGPLSFGIGVPASKKIATTFDPPAEVCWEGGSLPSIAAPAGGQCSTDGTYTISYNGDLNAPPASFTLQLRATNMFGTTRRTFAVNLSPTLAIVSRLDCSTFSFCSLPVEYGKPMSYRVVATGNPTPRLSLDTTGSDFTGLRFVDHGDGTGTLSGTPTGSPFAGGTCGDLLNNPCGGFVATNSTQGSTIQRFRLGITPAPQAMLDLPNGFIFPFEVGVGNAVRLTSFNHKTSVSWVMANNPSWLTLQDNGDNTATLRGTPPPGTTGYASASVGLTAAGSTRTIRTVLIEVLARTAFSSANRVTLRSGTPASFSPAATLGTISTSSELPSGITFTPGNPASLAGTPLPGSGGFYPLQLTASAVNSSATQELGVTVNDPPLFNSPNAQVLFVGRPASFEVTALGHPSLSTRPVPVGPLYSRDPEDGMQMLVSGLPPSLTASNRNALGHTTSTLRITGTPTAADVGTHRVTVGAFNTIGGVPVTQTLTLQVWPYNPIAPVSLLGTWTLARMDGQVRATVVIANNGSQDAQNVSLTGARIGSVTASIFPGQLPAIPAGGSGTFRLSFPASSLGAAGSAGVLSLTGSHSGGSFSNSGRIVLP
jgi:hypothetical protein